MCTLCQLSIIVAEIHIQNPEKKYTEQTANGKENGFYNIEKKQHSCCYFSKYNIITSIFVQRFPKRQIQILIRQLPRSPDDSKNFTKIPILNTISGLQLAKTNTNKTVESLYREIPRQNRSKLVNTKRYDRQIDRHAHSSLPFEILNRIYRRCHSGLQ